MKRGRTGERGGAGVKRGGGAGRERGSAGRERGSGSTEPASTGGRDRAGLRGAEPALLDESFTERVYQLVRRVPRGRVVSYGGVAALMGHPRAARGVGQALHALPEDSDVPWWRVVNRNGEISIRGVLHGASLQKQLLRAEGVRFNRAGRIDWRRYGWVPEEE